MNAGPRKATARPMAAGCFARAPEERPPDACSPSRLRATSTSVNALRPEHAGDLRLDPRRLIAACFLGVAALCLFGCGNMKKQRYARPLTPTPHLNGGTSAQLPPAHTVPHADARPDEAAASDSALSGRGNPQPPPLTAQLVERGRERFTIYCAVCHGDDGYGRGIVVRRGFPAPPSFHDPRLIAVPVSYIVEVITKGHGVMYSYADRVAPSDRWAIAAYVRTLQLSQRVPANALSADERGRINPR